MRATPSPRVAKRFPKACLPIATSGSTPPPTAAERFEALEQLRALGHGRRIAVSLWDGPMEPGVDTQEDLDRVRKQLGHV